ncbi:chloride channel CLIC-like protein 1 [Salarias fasciatus]|uniref:Chloride channel CLIC-like protein 1 n=1 Tax=Salarias fasciatus TaxID=181472 RepID=A0A672JR72_SALFA|nr:chloride channel CLIC-like protein 1 [Salarias fasciatus]
MLLIFVAFSLWLPVLGQQGGDEWLDPYDMINYDASTKTMRKSSQTTNYDNVATKRREYTQDSDQAELLSCTRQVAELQRRVEDLKKTTPHFSQQSTCNPVFKRFLNRLLKEISRVGVPSDSTDVFYDAKIKLSKQAITEIQALLEGEDRWRTGALDNAISQILVDLKPHDHIAWKWRFEDTFGVELDTVLKMGVAVLIMVAIMCTQMWSTVSWFVQFSRLFAVCFFLSIIWNWFYLYKIAFAEHQSKIVKMDTFNEKCTGVKKIDWSDSLKELFRSTLTLQDDPCKMYYEVLYINPILLVPPTKAMSVTITTFITEPMKHFGQGISEFLRALLKDLPITLQIPVLFTIIFSIVVCMYGSVQSAFQYGIMAPLRRPRRDPPPPELDQRPPPPLRNEHQNQSAGGDLPPLAGERPALPQRDPGHGAAEARSRRNLVHQRRPNKVQTSVPVKTLRPVDPLYSEDETDAAHREENPEVEEDLYRSLGEENQQEAAEVLETPTVGKAAKSASPTKTKPAESDSSRSEKKPLKENDKLSQDELRRDSTVATSQPAEKQPSHVDIQDPAAKTSSISVAPVETVGVPVHEMNST